MADNFIHLHCHDEYSLLDGFGTAAKYAEKIKENCQLGMALTNHGNVDGAIKFQNSFKEAGLIPIHGCEFYIVNDIYAHEKGEKRRHLIALVKNEKGWINILQMLTIANIEGQFYRPRISPQILLDHCEGLIISTACTSSFIQDEWGKQLLKKLSKIIPDDTYCELMPHQISGQKETNKLALHFAHEYGLKIIATNDCHYISNGDEKAQEVLLAIQSKKKWNDPNRWKFDAKGLYAKTRKEMQKAFLEQGQLNKKQIDFAFDNTLEIFDKCKGFYIPQRKVDLPAIPELRNGEYTNNQYLRKLCRLGFKKRILSDKNKEKKSEIYLDRMNEELEIIIKQGFCGYFLIVWEVMKWCKENDIMTGPGRGSAGGSLICYLLEITHVDPIEFNLLFARFISPARIDLPDIDNDFQDNKRHLVMEHFQEIYGEFSTVGVGTFMTMKGRGALRDVSRVFDIPLVDVNSAAKSIVVRSGGDFRSSFTVQDAFEAFEDGKKFKEKYPEVTDITIKLEGQTRGKGQHAAAIVLSNDDLRNGYRANLLYGSKVQSNKKKDLITNWDKHDIEYFGLMKLDILGLNALTILNEARKLIKENKNIDIDYNSIKLDDGKVLEEFTKGNTIGIFQFGSLGLRRLCSELGIDNFMLLSHANALYRPGTLRSGMVDVFVARKKGLEKYNSIHPAIDKLTKDTYGVILYQEQVMQFMYDLGGLGWKTADTVRKVMSKSQGTEQFQKFKKLFAEGCAKKKTLKKEEAEKLWDELSSFGSYGFNKSHACEYAVISFWQMWLKIYYPNEFICASLTYGSENKKSDLVEEAIRLGLDVRPPKIGKSKAAEWFIKNNILYAPFIEIKGFGEKTAQQAAGSFKQENNKYGSLFDPDDLNKNISLITIKGKGKDILSEINSNIDEEVTDQQAAKIDKYFGFSFCRNTARKFDSIINTLSKGLKISKISDIIWTEKNYNYRYYFGQMTQIKYSYKSSLDSNNSGGVYGNFKDNENYSMLVFEPDLYSKRKYEIEHCSGDFLIAKANHPRKATHIKCAEAWLSNDIIKLNLKELNLKLAHGYEYRNLLISKCIKCSLREECSAPVSPSIGKYNIMIIGEAPGKTEDYKGKGFVGDSGNLLWEELAKYKYSRNMFHTTNVVKCFTSPNIKIYTSKGIKKISEIKIGDLVLTHKGKFKKVEWIRPRETIKRGSKLIRLTYSISDSSKHTRTIEITPEHPFLSNGKWKKACDFKKGDKISVLGKRCKKCNSIIPFCDITDFCSHTCRTVFSNENRVWTKKSRRKTSKNMKSLYKEGILDNKEIVKNANKVTRKKIKEGTFHLSHENRTFVPFNKGKNKYNSLSIAKIAKKTRDKNLKSGHLNRLGRIGAKALRKYYKTHERTFRSKNNGTKIENIMAWCLKKRGLDSFVQNKYLLGYYPDILFSKEKLIIECDGEYWHIDPERDRERDLFFENNGYSTIRFKGKDILNSAEKCVDEIERILKNHNGQYCFCEVNIIKTRYITASKTKTLYNFGVEGDNSYIANGLISHNCFPSKTKTPTKRHINSCSRIIDDEIEKINPPLILAFGNTSLKYLLNQDSGIMDKNGTTEWVEKAKAWVCWCIHPASVLYHNENKKLFVEGIKNFANKIKIVGMKNE